MCQLLNHMGRQKEMSISDSSAPPRLGARLLHHSITALAVFVILAAPPIANAQTLTERLKSEGATALAVASREQGDSARGAALFPRRELGCTNCHAVSTKNLFGPDLTQREKRATDEELVESILNPSKVIRKGFESVTLSTLDGRVLAGRIIEKSDSMIVLRATIGADAVGAGKIVRIRTDEIDEQTPSTKSGMPDNLADQLSNRQQFLDLARYVMQLADTPAPTTQQQRTRELAPHVSGLALLDELQCVACHKDSISRPSDFPRRRAPNLRWSAGKVDPNYVTAFLAAPQQTKPGTVMPDMLHGLSEAERKETAEALTHYLTSLGDAPFVRQELNAESAQRGHELFHSIGCVACHSPRDETGKEIDSGSFLLGLATIEKKYSLAGLTAFLENPHASRPSGRMPNMLLTHWEATDVAQYLLRASDEEHRDTKFAVDERKALTGKRLFTSLQCVQCHEGVDPKIAGRDPIGIRAGDSLNGGCLAERPPAAAARYQLTDDQRQQLRHVIPKATQVLSLDQRIDLTLTAFNCVACHERDGLGGVPENRDDYFLTTNPNLGPQGRIPPPLTGAGAKLKSDWMRQVLVSGRSIRPYMKTRMPQFGADNVSHVVELLKTSDKLPDVEYANVSDEKELKKTASDLMGSQGMNCVACHTFQHKPGQTMPAVDITEMADRLEKNWFYHYMSEPQKFHRGTVMPTFWPGGKAMRQDILEGDAELQKEAIWRYLLDGRQARTPRGLVIEPIELKSTDEAVMLRRSYPGIGKRGIGVGYPAQVNIVFDAEQLQLSMLWNGMFADPGGVWRSQGHGSVRPLSREVIRFGKGPDLDSQDNPWVVDDGRPSHHQFRGYFLDEMRRPTFMYGYDGIEVEDQPKDVLRDPTSPFMQRTLKFKTARPRSGLQFRAASGEKIIPQENGEFLVDNKLRVRILGEYSAATRTGENDTRLLVPLELPEGESKLVIEYTLP